MFDEKVRKKRSYCGRSYLGALALPAIFLFCTVGYGLAAKPVDSSLSELKSPESLKSSVSTGSLGTLDEVCALIAKGEFSGAGSLIDSAPEHYDSNLDSLLRIIHEYQAISERRQAEREEAYRKKLSELEQYRVGDGNDVNDVNSVTKELSIISKVAEFANEEQKSELLSDPFVKGVFEGSIERAEEYERQGKWIDSYITSYSWLQSIMPDKKEYSEHAEQLLEKANIGGSFVDSPCETRKERHAKIESRMFIRAIEALHFNYVNIIDYRQMALKALKRCKLLTDVVDSSSKVRETLWEKDPKSGDGLSDYEQQFAAWSSSLSGLLDEVEASVIGLGKEKFVELFEKLLGINDSTLELPRRVLIAQFSEAALSELDPYTVMIWPRQVEEFEKTMTNEFTGIGIEISKQKGLLTVSSLLPDTPAYNSGLDAGDVIEEVDDVPTKDMSLTCAVRSITGPAGTKVVLKIRRNGQDDTMEIPIIRAKITVPTIRGWQRTEEGKWLYLIDEENRIGYVRLTSFSSSSAGDFEKVLSQLEADGVAGLILDLRYNSGGLLDSAVAVVDKFVDEGLIVKTQPRYIATYKHAHKEKTHPNYPLVILTNRYSASASEIVAGALQDKSYKRAVIVGERTHGKGSVQGITPYPGDKAQLKYTMAYYHLPSGQRVESRSDMKKQDREDWGITPDIEIRLRSDEMKKMIDVQRDNDVLVQANMAGQHKSLKKRGLEETLESDPQLAAALLIMKSKLIQRKAQEAASELARL